MNQKGSFSLQSAAVQDVNRCSATTSLPLERAGEQRERRRKGGLAEAAAAAMFPFNRPKKFMPQWLTGLRHHIPHHLDPLLPRLHAGTQERPFFYPWRIRPSRSPPQNLVFLATRSHTRPHRPVSASKAERSPLPLALTMRWQRALAQHEKKKKEKKRKARLPTTSRR